VTCYCASCSRHHGRRIDEKYRGSYETSVLGPFGQFANSTHVNEDLEKIFTLIALNRTLRNAHLKTFESSTTRL
jgi:hypothetical protein